MEEILVTATKRSEPLQDVPISISAISGDDIKARGYTQFGDYLDAVPGVYFQDGGPGVSVVHIRGATEAGVGSTVATYFGETVTSVFTNQGGKPNLRLVDIDRIEVLRGPQGTLFGADALVGVLRIIPNAPDAGKFGVDLETRGFTTAHSNDTSYHVAGTVNIPLIQDRLALRLVAYKDQIGGFIDNIVPAQTAIDYSAAFATPPGTLVTPAIDAFTRKDINDEDTWGARAALRWATDSSLYRGSQLHGAGCAHLNTSLKSSLQRATTRKAVHSMSSKVANTVSESGGHGSRHLRLGLDVARFRQQLD